MKLEFKYTNELVSYLLNIERYKTALEYLYLPTRTKQNYCMMQNLKNTFFYKHRRKCIIFKTS